MYIPEIDRRMLHLLWSRVVNRVAYEMGGKPALDADSHLLETSDCSGFTRWILARCTSQQLVLPEGSVEQHEWASQHLSPPYSYRDAALQDNQVRICFLSPEAADRAGRPGDRHVWLTQNGMTMECHGGGGCTSRPWDTEILTYADGCYILPSHP